MMRRILAWAMVVVAIARLGSSAYAANYTQSAVPNGAIIVNLIGTTGEILQCAVVAQAVTGRAVGKCRQISSIPIMSLADMIQITSSATTNVVVVNG